MEIQSDRPPRLSERRQIIVLIICCQVIIILQNKWQERGT